MESTNILAIEIGGTKLQLIIYSREGEVLGRWRKAIDADKAAAGIRNDIRDIIIEIRKSLTFAHIGVGFGGPVDREKGTICTSHQVNGWQGFDLAGWLNELTLVPVYLENDANVAALGEAHFGAGQDFRTVFYMTAGSGIGGGLVQDKQLYCGRAPGEAEIGHLRMDMEGTTLESVCSGWAVDGLVRASAREHPDSILAGIVNATSRPDNCQQGNGRQPDNDRHPDGDKQPDGTGHRLTGGEARSLRPALEQRCPVAQDILRLVGQRLAWGLSHVVHLYHPDVLIIGGGLSLLGRPLKESVKEQLPDFVMKAFLPPPPVKLAALGEDVVPLGALALTRMNSESFPNLQSSNE